MTVFFEDVEVGSETVIGSYVFTAEDIVRFARKYDPQPFHLSEEAAQKTHFGRLCASGWHTASVYMKLNIAKTKELDAQAREQGLPIARYGPSPGFEDLKWIRPVFAGDTITYKRVVAGKTESRSRPHWGIVHGENHGFNQNGEPVFSFKSNVFVERKPA